jgi:hypothetical protein
MYEIKAAYQGGRLTMKQERTRGFETSPRVGVTTLRPTQTLHVDEKTFAALKVQIEKHLRNGSIIVRKLDAKGKEVPFPTAEEIKKTVEAETKAAGVEPAATPAPVEETKVTDETPEPMPAEDLEKLQAGIDAQAAEVAAAEEQAQSSGKKKGKRG